MVWSTTAHFDSRWRSTVGFITCLFGLGSIGVIIEAILSLGGKFDWSALRDTGNALLFSWLILSALCKVFRVGEVIFLPLNILAILTPIAGIALQSSDTGAIFATVTNFHRTNASLLAGFLLIVFPLVWFMVDALDITYYIVLRDIPAPTSNPTSSKS